MPNTKYKYKNLLVTPEDREVIKFLTKKLGGTPSFAIKESMRRYARSRGFRRTEAETENVEFKETTEKKCTN